MFCYCEHRTLEGSEWKRHCERNVVKRGNLMKGMSLGGGI